MAYLLKGAMVEYSSDFLGPLPNVVIFQFNPESLSRVQQIPSRSSTARSREMGQSGEPTYEQISLTAHFSAADELGEENVLARLTGIGPQLAALQMMVSPKGTIAGLIGAAVDAIGSLVGLGGDSQAATPIPREKYPKVLFIWGPTRVLPVSITSMTIIEQKFDFVLNPVQAEVQLTLDVLRPDPCSSDVVARGTLEYSRIATEVLAMTNLANTAEEVVEMIPF
jgi:hypothetical protein